MIAKRIFPLGVLDKCVDQSVWILMKNPREFGGVLRGFDDFFNLVLQDVTQIWTEEGTKLSRKHQGLLLNGHDIAFVVPGVNPLLPPKQ